MLDLQADMAVFFDEEGFAMSCTRERPGEDSVTFSGIVSTTDEVGFEGEVQAPSHRLLYPTAAADVRRGDTITTTATNQAGASQPAQSWKVTRDPQRTLDGLQSVAYLRRLAE